jgi:hypothetical protein
MFVSVRRSQPGRRAFCFVGGDAGAVAGRFRASRACLRVSAGQRTRQVYAGAISKTNPPGSAVGPGRFPLMEAGRWTGEEVSGPIEVEPGIETADVGIFHFIRLGHTVRLNVDVSGSLCRGLLEMTADRKAWDWGE